MATIGENLRRIRGDEDQKEVAARMQIPQTRLSNWEKNRYQTLTIKTLLWLAKGYRCSVEAILQGVDDEYDAARDLTSHTDQGSSSAAHSKAQRKDVDGGEGAAAARIRQQLEARAAFLSNVQDVATVLNDVITREAKRLAGEDRAAATDAARRRRPHRKAG